MTGRFCWRGGFEQGVGQNGNLYLSHAEAVNRRIMRAAAEYSLGL